MRIQDLDWEELHTLLVFLRTGSLEASADELRTRTTTVARRLERLERKLGHVLVDRRGRRSRPDVSLEGASAHLKRLESLLSESFERMLEAMRTEKLRVRITTTPALSEFLIAPRLTEIISAVPQAELLVTSETEALSLADREADFAIRLGRVVDPLLVGRRVAEYGYGLYGARDHWAAVRPRDLDRMEFELVGEEEDPEYVSNRWLSERFPKRIVRARFDLSSSIASFLAHSRYLGVIPCYLGDARQDLVRVLGPEHMPRMPVYLLAHRNFKRHPVKVLVYRELARIFEDSQGALRG